MSTSTINVDWFFDVISPFAYIQHILLQRDPLRGPLSITLTPHPVLFASLLDHWGQLGPAEIPQKRLFTFEHASYLCHRLNIPFTNPTSHPFNPLPLLRLVIAADSLNRDSVIDACFRFVWEHGHVPTDTKAWKDLLTTLNMNEHIISTDHVKDVLKENSKKAVALGVFGVPTLVVHPFGDELVNEALRSRLFWGMDATEMARGFLKGDAFFRGKMFSMAGDIPIGIERKKIVAMRKQKEENIKVKL